MKLKPHDVAEDIGICAGAASALSIVSMSPLAAGICAGVAAVSLALSAKLEAQGL